jgi:hypothetical protein
LDDLISRLKKIPQQKIKLNTQNINSLPFLKDLQNNKINYFPIEWLKKKTKFDKLIQKNLFLSSGTSSKNRSHSFFSDKGLQLYETSSVLTFHSVLKENIISHNPFEIEGISLIPRKETLPQSSLAHMICSFSKIWKVHYLDNLSLQKFDTTKPVWVFATAFDLIKCFDNKIKINLHPQSLIIETGGNKGLTRNINKKELYKTISQTFTLKKDRIISEYSMAELCSQAYTSPSSNIFKFPEWVKLSIMTPIGQIRPYGTGSLIIQDHLRIDLPYFLRSEDIVKLKKDCSFEILGRVPSSVQKGCSFTSMQQEKNLYKDITLPTVKTKSDCSLRITTILDLSKKLYSNPSLLKSLEKDLKYPKIALSALNDLKLSTPNTVAKWKKAINKSESKIGDHWLIILPNSHPLVCFYPLMLAYAAGLRITIKYPKRFGKKSTLGFVHEFLHKYDPDFIQGNYQERKRLLSSNLQGVLCYGNNQTIKDIKSQYSCTVQGFSNSISINLIEEQTTDNLRKVVKDAFSLCQKGCLSSQILLITSLPKKNLVTELSLLSKNFIADLSAEDDLACEHENLFFQEQLHCSSTRLSKKTPLFPIIEYQNNIQNINILISQRSFVLPIVYVKTTKLADLLEKIYDLHYISIKTKNPLISTIIKKQNKQQITKLGQLNIPDWDGLHEKTPLFKSTQ